MLLKEVVKKWKMRWLGYGVCRWTALCSSSAHYPANETKKGNSDGKGKGVVIAVLLVKNENPLC